MPTRFIPQHARDFLALLRGVVDDGDAKWKAYCPVHESTGEHRPSLGVTIGEDEKVILKCLACSATTVDIVHAAGSTMRALFPPPVVKGRGKQRHGKKVAEYIYRDAEGIVVYKTERREQPDGTKTFIQSRRIDGGWKIGVKGIQRVLYRLPELIAAKPGSTVFVVEGEKKAEALANWGLIATCNVGGAGKWSKSYGRYLAGHDVVTLPDNDPVNVETGRRVGFDHATQIIESARSVAKSIRILELPGLPLKGDVVDWIAAGGTLPRLLQLLEQPAGELPATKVDAKHKIEKPAELPTIKNYKLVEAETEEGTKLVPEPIPIIEIEKKIIELTGGWPKRVGDRLFAQSEPDSVSWLFDADAVFSYCGKTTGPPPSFKVTSGYHTKKEVVSHLTRSVEAFDAVELLPHEPLIAKHFYACNGFESGDGLALKELIDRFNPESEVDRDLVTAAFVTPFWGGTGGSRPAFCFTSDAGKGSGKSTLSSCIGQLAGGALDVSANEDIAALKSRLLSPDGVSRRVLIFDNIKTHRLSWAELESLITAPVISGKRLYVGEASRPNTITFIMTMNGVSLSTDMAQRSVVIKLSKPEYSGTWAEDTRALIESKRRELISDIMAFLRKPRGHLEKFSRWGDWEKEVLSRLQNPSGCQKVIRERQAVVDVDEEESVHIEEFFAKRLSALGYDTSVDRIFIPASVAAKWLASATGERVTVTKSSRTLIQRITEGQFQKIAVCANRNHGRGFEFWGEDSTGETYMQIDLEDQIKKYGAKWELQEE